MTTCACILVMRADQSAALAFPVFIRSVNLQSDATLKRELFDDLTHADLLWRHYIKEGHIRVLLRLLPNRDVVR
jgi:hypothetical protein